MSNAKPPKRQARNANKSREELFSLAGFFPGIFSWRLGMLAFTFFLIGSAQAHPARLASGVAEVDSVGNVKIDLTIDLPAFLLNDTPDRVADSDMNALLDGPREDLAAALTDMQDRLLHSTKLQDGVIDSVAVPRVDEIRKIKKGPMRLPLMMDVSLCGHLSREARAFSIDLPEALGSIVLTVDRPNADARAFAIEGGDFSPALPVAMAQATLTPETAPVPPEPGRINVAVRYVILGFQHILPRGPDHILFILGLFLLSTRMSSLLWQISAFTIAHSITLGLAMYGIVRLPAGIVEPAIAASIAFVAVENLLTTKLNPWRPIVVFFFGLVHGMGFASVLLGMGLPRTDFAPALFSFNAGVELGQLAVVGCALLAVGWFRRYPWYRYAVVVPLSVMIAISGIAWTVQRLI